MSKPQPATPAGRVVLDGRYTRIEPLAQSHAADLFAAAEPERFRYLSQVPPVDVADMSRWIGTAALSADPMYFTVIDKATGRAEGRNSLMRIDPTNAVIELGGIYWGPRMSRTRVATEAFYLMARHIFEDLGNRRFEWKCNDLNEPSKRAAIRFGFTFEGLFRQHMIFKGDNRDTAWFSMLDGEWPERKAGFERWLDPGNFDAEAKQLSPLAVR
ncbi:GNAT family protein [Devosia sp. ZB163]|uniref:GNAT family N-acetyltransferase n=1 Tax=Devosia sp. ZB163 TaxID=3025938 RepID=UPI00235F8663|nr:GNAT family protein [Devosia sp. ZB163]MDC9822850.1 GNAT family protein [Devosia sp. ZB163]